MESGRGAGLLRAKKVVHGNTLDLRHSARLKHHAAGRQSKSICAHGVARLLEYTWAFERTHEAPSAAHSLPRARAQTYGGQLPFTCFVASSMLQLRCECRC